jgi:hypothetical protein
MMEMMRVQKENTNEHHLIQLEMKEREWRVRHSHSGKKLLPPSPPDVMAFMNLKNLSPYSRGGTGLILC